MTKTADPRLAAKGFRVFADGRHGTVFVEHWSAGCWEVWVRWQNGPRSRLTTQMTAEQATLFLAGMKGLCVLQRGNEYLYVPPLDTI